MDNYQRITDNESDNEGIKYIEIPQKEFAKMSFLTEENASTTMEKNSVFNNSSIKPMSKSDYKTSDYMNTLNTDYSTNETHNVDSSSKLQLSSIGLFGPIIFLFSSSMGAGWMSTPKAFVIYGLGFATIMEIVNCTNMFIALILMSRLMIKYPNCSYYTDMVNTVLGKKPRMIYNCLVFFNMNGCNIAYVLIGHNFLKD